MQATPPTPPDTPALLWDVFCRVVDNFGDIGVCWRLCRDLAARGQRLRLWVDDPSALAWMAPGALEGRVTGVQVLHWPTPFHHADLEALALADMWIEAFGTDPAPEFVQTMAARIPPGAQPPVWINLEYLSAEPYVERSHGLPSPVLSGAARGWTKWFFYPGFTPATGGLLREPNLFQRQAAFDSNAWLARHLPSLHTTALEPLEQAARVSLFCYEPKALPDVLRQADQDRTASDWLVTPGRAAHAVAAVQQSLPPFANCRLHTLPQLSQVDYDHLLWSCDLNFVRGEDSLVRALWAGKALVWHIYPQDDNAHHAKLEAFLDWLQAPESLRRFHRTWNGLDARNEPWPGWDEVRSWGGCVQAARQRLLDLDDLSSQLLGFVAKKR